MKPMIFFDIDGTLMDSASWSFPASVKPALLSLQKKGYKLGIATGRAKNSFLRTKAQDLIKWDLIIVANGMGIYDGNMNPLFEASFDHQSVRECVETASKLGFVVLIKSQPRFITGPNNPYVQEVHDYFNNVVPPVGKYIDQEVEGMIIYAPHGYDYAPFKQIRGLHVMPCALCYAEVSVEGISKATSIQRGLKMLGAKEYIAFGDSPNDLEMLKGSSLSVVMGGSCKEVCEAADFITKPVLEDGIEYACRQLKLID